MVAHIFNSWLLTASIVFICGVIRCGVCKSVQVPPSVTQVTRPVLHAEGPHWDAERGVLWFVDINDKRLNCYQPSTGRQTNASVDGLVTFVIPIKGSRLLSAGIDHDLVYVAWSGEEGAEVTVEVVATVDREPGQERNRFNDAKADARGRLWAGTMGYEHLGAVEPKKGSLYSFDTDSDAPVSRLTNVDISNGLAWNADNTIMYYIDSATRRVDAFDFDLESGAISNRRPVFHLSHYNLTGIPDGMTIDADGNLWVALFNGWRVINVDPRNGALIGLVEMPARDVTSATFGGPNLDILYVTTSRKDLTPEQAAGQPGAGAVFAIGGTGARGTAAGNSQVVRDNLRL